MTSNGLGTVPSATTGPGPGMPGQVWSCQQTRALVRLHSIALVTPRPWRAEPRDGMPTRGQAMGPWAHREEITRLEQSFHALGADPATSGRGQRLQLA